VALAGSDFPEFNLTMSDREDFLAWFNTDWEVVPGLVEVEVAVPRLIPALR